MSSSSCVLSELLNKNHERKPDKPTQMSMTSLRKKRLQVQRAHTSGNTYDTQVMSEFTVGNLIIPASQLNGQSPFGGPAPVSAAPREKHSLSNKTEDVGFAKQAKPNFMNSSMEEEEEE